MKEMEITELTVHELQEKLKKKEITLPEITKAYAKRIEAKEKDVQAFLTILAEDAEKQSTEIQQKVDKGEEIGS